MRESTLRLDEFPFDVDPLLDDPESYVFGPTLRFVQRIAALRSVDGGAARITKEDASRLSGVYSRLA
jgi:hypothetical protein